MMGYDFHRQKPINNYILDFFCQELMLGIELDGYTHQFTETFYRDMEKDKKMAELGITVLRFPDVEVMNNIENVIGIIENFILNFEEEHTPSPSQEGS